MESKRAAHNGKRRNTSFEMEDSMRLVLLGVWEDICTTETLARMRRTKKSARRRDNERPTRYEDGGG